MTPPTADDIADMAERALAAIPAGLAEHVRGVGISVEELPDEETLKDLEIESAWELTGLYQGTPLTERSVSDIARQPDLIFYIVSRSCWSGSKQARTCTAWCATCSCTKWRIISASATKIEAMEREMD